MVVRLDCDIPPKSFGSNILVRVPLPKATSRYEDMFEGIFERPSRVCVCVRVCVCGEASVCCEGIRGV